MTSDFEHRCRKLIDAIRYGDGDPLEEVVTFFIGEMGRAMKEKEEREVQTRLTPSG